MNLRMLTISLCAVVVMFVGTLPGEDKPQPAFSAPPITAVAFSPDGSCVVVGSQAGLLVKRWPGLEEIRKLPTELANVHDLRFSPDKKALLVAGGAPGESGGVELYQWPEGKRLAKIESHEDVICAITWSSDGSRFAATSADGKCIVYEASTQKQVATLTGHSRAVLGVVFLNDNKTLLTAGADQTLRLWNVESGQTTRTLHNHTDVVSGVALRPASMDDVPPMVASISDDRTVRFWQPTIGRMVRFTRLDSKPLDLVWSRDGLSLFVSASSGEVHRIDPQTAKIMKSSRPFEGWVYTLAIPGDGKTILAAGESGQVKVIEE